MTFILIVLWSVTHVVMGRLEQPLANIPSLTNKPAWSPARHLSLSSKNFTKLHHVDQSFSLLGGSSKVDILICTPGRLIDHLNGTPNFTLQHLRFLVNTSNSIQALNILSMLT